MFNGSENMPGDYFTYLQQIGATDYNGTTGNDRTNYFETVPAGALERALFMESDRMGYLLGAVTQGVLDNQRGVVQNEKRQGDSRPGGLVQYAAVRESVPGRATPIITRRSARWPTSTPPAWPTSSNGSATNTARTMRCWWSPATSRAAAGEAAGREIFRRDPGGPGQPSGDGRRCRRWPRPSSIDMKDAVATTIIQRNWAVPGCSTSSWRRSTSAARCSAGSPARGSTMRWSANEKLAVAVSAGSSRCSAPASSPSPRTVKPGVDPALVAKRLDEIVADYHRQGPDRGRGPARGDAAKSRAESAGSSRSAASAARRSRWPRARRSPANSNFYKTTLDRICRGHAGRRSARRCSNG